MKKKLWKRMLGLVMSMLLVLTSCPAAFMGNVIVQAAEAENLITDPTFQDSTAWTVVGDAGDNGESYASYSFEDGKAVFHMKAYGDVFWKPCIKTTEPINLQENSVYRATFTVESDMARTVQGGFDTNHHFSDEVALVNEGDLYKATVTYDYTVGNAEENYFIVCLGGGMNQEEFAEHTVKVSDVSVVRIGDKPEDPDLGPLPDAEQNIPVVDGNLLTNGNLADVDTAANTAAGWNLIDYLTGAEVSVEPYRVNYDIASTQADYQVNLNQDFQAEYKAEYAISFDVETTLERTVTYGMEKNGRLFTETSQVIPANTKTTVTAAYQSSNEGTQKFMIYLGGNYQKHKVGISNISIVKTKDGEEKGYESIEGFEEPVSTAEVEGNLLPNGNFANGMDGWMSQFPDNVINNKNRVDIKVTESNETYWAAGGLKTTAAVSLKKGNTYRIRYTAVSTIDRSVYADLDINGAPKYFGEGIDLQAGIPGTFDREVTMEEDLSGVFAIWFGGPTDLETPHYIGISDVSIVLTKEGEGGNEGGGDTPDPKPDENTLPEAQPTDIVEGNMLQNGNFADGLSGWRSQEPGNVVAETNRIDIKVTANTDSYWAAGGLLTSENVTMKEGNTYRLRYTAISTVDRSVYADLDPGAPKVFGDDGSEKLILKAGEAATYEKEVTMDRTVIGPLAIWFGGVSDVETPHYIGISDVSLVLVKEGEGGGETPDPTPENPLPEAQPTEDVENNILTNGNFANGLEGWSTAGFAPIATTNRVDFHVVANGLDWNPSLVANEITLEPNSEYTIQFHAYSTVARVIGIRKESGNSKLEPQSTNIEANKDEVVTFTYTTGDEAESLQLMICVGAGFTDQEVEEGKFQAHYVGISQVSMVKTGGAETIQYGDMNNDNKVTAIDALILLNKVINGVELNETEHKVADVNKDDSVDTKDVQAILQMAVQKIEYK